MTIDTEHDADVLTALELLRQHHAEGDDFGTDAALTIRRAMNEIERLRAEAKAAYDVLSDMHAEDDSCQFRGGEGCLACMAQEALSLEPGKRFAAWAREERLRREIEAQRARAERLENAAKGAYALLWQQCVERSPHCFHLIDYARQELTQALGAEGMRAALREHKARRMRRIEEGRWTPGPDHCACHMSAPATCPNCQRRGHAAGHQPEAGKGNGPGNPPRRK
jgi:hypothetical protein